MIVLIRNLTPIAISDVIPHSTDVSEGADLSRIKYYRNQVAHNKEWWNDITKVFIK
jgi:hypothetical protein